MDQSPRSVPRSSRYRFSEDRSETSEVSSFVRDSKQLETHASRFRQRERDDSEESVDLFVAIADYTPGQDEPDGLVVVEGQIVEVVDSSDPKRFLVRTRPVRHIPTRQGWIPALYLEKKLFGEARKRTRELPVTEANTAAHSGREAEALSKRDLVIKDIVDSERQYVQKLRYVMDTYIKALDQPSVPENLRGESEIFLNWKELCTFHETVLLPGLEFCIDEPRYLEKTFLRLERDFDKLTAFCRDEPEAQKLLSESPELMEFLGKITPFENFDEAEQTISDLLQLPVKRVAEYQEFIKELIKYAARAKQDVKGLQKALDMLLGVPHRAQDIELLKSIKGYRGNIHKLGRIIKNDAVVIWEEADPKKKGKDRHLFLFKDRILVTKMVRGESSMGAPPQFNNKGVIQLANIDVKDLDDEDDRVFSLGDKSGSAGGVTFQTKSASSRASWTAEIRSLIKGGLSGLPAIDIDDHDHSSVSNLARTDTEDFAAGDRSRAVDVSRAMRTEKTQTQSMEEMVQDMQGRYLRVMTEQLTREEQYRELKSISEAPEFEDHTTLPYMRKSTERISCVVGETVRFDSRVCGIPTPEVTWWKDDVELVRGDKYEIKLDGQIHTLVIHDVMPEDRGLYTCQAKNKNGTVRYHPELMVRGAFPTEIIDEHNWEFLHRRTQSVMDVESITSEVANEEDFVHEDMKHHRRVPTREDEHGRTDEPMDIGYSDERKRHHDMEMDEETPKRRDDMTPPKLHFSTINDEAFTVRPNETLKIEIPYDGRPHPTIDFKKDGRALISSAHIQTEDKDSIATLTVFDIRPEDSGTYSVKAENEAGIDKVDIIVQVQGVPDAPRNFKASEITPDTCVLKWDRPLNDGGHPILRYNIERRGMGRKTWQRVGTTRNTEFEAENLLEDQTYEFKVTAENINGEGEGVELQEPVVAQFTFGPPGTPDTPTVLNVVNRTCTVSWNKPESDGGSSITGYLLERRNSISPHWVKVTTETIETTDFVVSDLLSSTEYEFRVRAINKAGESNPSQPSKIVKTRAWSVAEDEEGVNRSYRPSMERSTSNLSTRDVDDVFARQESLAERTFSRESSVARRMAGRQLNGERSPDSRSISLQREISPGAREQETVEERIQRRSEERRTRSLSRSNRPTASSQLEEFEKKIALEENLERQIHEQRFKFELGRVSADRESVRLGSEKRSFDDVQSDTALERKAPYSRRAESHMSTESDFSSEFVKTNGDLTGMPGAVVQEDTIQVEKGRSLHINIPFFGNPMPHATWKFNDQPIKESLRIRIDTVGNETSLNIKQMSMEDAGVYSLTLENETGRLEAHINVKILDAPSAPRNLKVIGSSPESIKLTWEAPDQPGGGPVLNYIAEKKLSGRKLWQHAGETADTEIIAENLLEGQEYYFSVKAENRYGVGPATETDRAVAAKWPFNPPGACGAPEVSDIRKTSAIISWEPPADDGGSPVTGYYIERKYIDSNRFMKITKEPVTNTVFMVTDLVVGFEYLFRIIAVNLAGEGKPSQESQLVVPFETADQFAPHHFPEGHRIRSQAEENKEAPQFFAKKHTLQEDEDNVQHRQVKRFADRAMSDIASTMDDVESIREVSVMEEVDETGTSVRRETSRTVTSRKGGAERMEDLEERTEKSSERPSKRPTSTTRHLETEDEEFDEISQISEVSERIEHRVIRRSKSKQRTMVDTGTDAAPYSEPKLHRPSKDQRLITVKEEEDLTLEIPYTGAPKPEFTWYKDGKPVTESKHIQTESTDEFARITVRETTKKDSGRYTLLAENFAGVDKIDIGVQVVDKREYRESSVMTEMIPEAPKLLLPKKFQNRETQVEEHQPLILEVPYTGTPLPRITWMKDGKVIEETKTITIETREDVIRLIIMDARPQHTGQYQILAQNDLGRDQAQIPVRVIRAQEVQTDEVRKKPSIEKPAQYSKGVQVETDEQIRLEIPVTGTPKPEVQWYKDDKKIVQDQRIQTDFATDKAILTVDKATTKDAGTYTVSASNAAGEAEEDVVVEVTETTTRTETTTKTKKVRKVAPKIRKPVKQPVQVREHDNLTLEVPFESDAPVEVKWTKDGKPLHESKMVQTEVTESTARLTVQKVAKKDAGTYNLLVENEFGADHVSIGVEVLDETDVSGKRHSTKPELPEKFVEVHEMDTLAITVSHSQGNVPQVTLYHDDELVTDAGARHVTVTADTKTIKLEIDQVEMEDAGRYKIVAKSSSGADVFNIGVDVIGTQEMSTAPDKKKPTDYTEDKRSGKLHQPSLPFVTQTSQKEMVHSVVEFPVGDDEGASDEDISEIEESLIVETLTKITTTQKKRIVPHRESTLPDKESSTVDRPVETDLPDEGDAEEISRQHFTMGEKESVMSEEQTSSVPRRGRSEKPQTVDMEEPKKPKVTTTPDAEVAPRRPSPKTDSTVIKPDHADQPEYETDMVEEHSEIVQVVETKTVTTKVRKNEPAVKTVHSGMKDLSEETQPETSVIQQRDLVEEKSDTIDDDDIEEPAQPFTEEPPRRKPEVNKKVPSGKTEQNVRSEDEIMGETVSDKHRPHTTENSDEEAIGEYIEEITTTTTTKSRVTKHHPNVSVPLLDNEGEAEMMKVKDSEDKPQPQRRTRPNALEKKEITEEKEIPMETAEKSVETSEVGITFEQRELIPHEEIIEEETVETVTKKVSRAVDSDKHPKKPSVSQVTPTKANVLPVETAAKVAELSEVGITSEQRELIPDEEIVEEETVEIITKKVIRAVNSDKHTKKPLVSQVTPTKANVLPQYENEEEESITEEIITVTTTTVTSSHDSKYPFTKTVVTEPRTKTVPVEEQPIQEVVFSLIDDQQSSEVQSDEIKAPEGKIPAKTVHPKHETKVAEEITEEDFAPDLEKMTPDYRETEGTEEDFWATASSKDVPSKKPTQIPAKPEQPNLPTAESIEESETAVEEMNEGTRVETTSVFPETLDKPRAKPTEQTPRQVTPTVEKTIREEPQQEEMSVQDDEEDEEDFWATVSSPDGKSPKRPTQISTKPEESTLFTTTVRESETSVEESNVGTSEEPTSVVPDEETLKRPKTKTTEQTIEEITAVVKKTVRKELRQTEKSAPENKEVEEEDFWPTASSEKAMPSKRPTQISAKPEEPTLPSTKPMKESETTMEELTVGASVEPTSIFPDEETLERPRTQTTENMIEQTTTSVKKTVRKEQQQAENFMPENEELAEEDFWADISEKTEARKPAPKQVRQTSPKQSLTEAKTDHVKTWAVSQAVEKTETPELYDRVMPIAQDEASHPLDSMEGALVESDTRRTTDQRVTEEGTVEEVITKTKRTRMTKEPDVTSAKKVTEFAEVGTEAVTKTVVEKPVEIWVIEDEEGGKMEIEVEEREGKMYDVKTGKELDLEGYDTVKTTVEEFTEEWEMETLQETGKEPEVKGTMQQTYKTTVATAEDLGVQAITTGNVKRIDYSQDETGKHYVEKNEPISSKQILSEPEVHALTDKDDGVMEETVEKTKQVRRRRPDGTTEDVPELEERTIETKRTTMSDISAQETVLVLEEKSLPENKEVEEEDFWPTASSEKAMPSKRPTQISAKPEEPTLPSTKPMKESETTVEERTVGTSMEPMSVFPDEETLKEPRTKTTEQIFEQATTSVKKTVRKEPQQAEKSETKRTPMSDVSGQETMVVQHAEGAPTDEPKKEEEFPLPQTPKPIGKPVGEKPKTSKGPKDQLVEEETTEVVETTTTTKWATRDVGETQLLDTRDVSLEEKETSMDVKESEALPEKQYPTELTESPKKKSVAKKPAEPQQADESDVKDVETEAIESTTTTEETKRQKRPETPKKTASSAETDETTTVSPLLEKPDEQSTRSKQETKVTKTTPTTTAEDLQEPDEQTVSEEEYSEFVEVITTKTTTTKTTTESKKAEHKSTEKTQKAVPGEEPEEQPLSEEEDNLPEAEPRPVREPIQPTTKPVTVTAPSALPAPVEVVSVTDSSVCLEWEAPPKTDSKDLEYVVEKRKSGRKVWSEVTTTSATEVEISDLQEGELYEFRVTPQNPVGSGTPSVIPGVHTHALPEPLAPVRVAFTKQIPTIEWKHPEQGPATGWSDLQKIVVQERTANEPKWHDIATVEGDKESFEVPFEDHEKEKDIRLISVNDVGESLPSQVVTVKNPEPVRKTKKTEEPVTNIETPVSAQADTGESVPREVSDNLRSVKVPTAPQNLTMSDKTADSITLSWDTPDATGDAPILNYVVEARPSDKKLYKPLGASSEPSYTATNLPVGTYDFRVVAQNENGPSEPAELLNIEMSPKQSKVGKPSRPGKPTAHDVTSAEVPLEWTPSAATKDAPVDGYNVYLREKGAKNWRKVTKVATKTTKHVLKDLASEVEFEAQVTAVNKAGESEPSQPSNTFTLEAEPSASETGIEDQVAAQKDSAESGPSPVSDKFETVTVPEAPQNLIVTDKTADSVSLGWDTPDASEDAPVLSYAVEARPSGNKLYKPLGTSSEPSYTATNLPAGPHDFRVTAHNEIGPSKPAELLKAEMGPQQSKGGKPSRPGKPTAHDVTSAEVPLEWIPSAATKDAPVDGYNVYLREKGAKNWRKVTKVATKTTKHVLKDLASEVEFEAQVTAVNKAGESEPSQPSDTFTLQPETQATDQDDVDENGSVWDAPVATDDAPVSSYAVEARPSGSKSYKPLGACTELLYTVTNLPVGPHDFRVTTENEMGLSEPAELLSVEISPTQSQSGKPSRPGKPTVHDVTSTEVPLEWTPSTSTKDAAVDGYHVYIRERGTKNWRKVTKVATKTTKHVLKDLESKVEFEAQVTAVNKAGESEPSQPSDAFVLKPEETVPSAPQNLEVLVAAVNNVCLKWDAPGSDGDSPVTHYVVQKRPKSSRTWEAVAETSNTEFTIPKIDEGIYDIQVIAVNKIGKSKPALASDVEVKGKLRIPKVPGQPEVSDITETAATISWPEPKLDRDEPVDGYNIYLREKGAKKWRKVTKAVVKKTSHQLSELEQGKDYEAAVTAVNQAGESEQSKPSSAFQLKPTQGKEVPSKPENLRATDIKPESVKLAWKAPTDDRGSPVTAYGVFKRPAGAKEDEWEEIGETPLTTFTVPHLEMGTPYDFKVTARNKIGESKPTLLNNIETAKTIKLPSEPGKPTVTVTNTDATITWTEPKSDGGAPVEGYHVYIREVEATNWKKLTRTLIKEKKYVHQNLTTGKIYEIQITAMNQVGESKASPPSDQFSAVVKKKLPPSPPTNLHPVSTTPDTITIAWSPPESDNGAAVTSYIVKKKRNGRKAWQDVAETAELTIPVPDLVENSSYDFSVQAVNQYGASEPVVIEDIYAKFSFKVPSAPGQPQVTEVTDTTATVEWTAPEDDGGNPITGFDVYMKSKKSTTWRKVTKTRTTVTRFIFENLEREVEYETKITAWNQAGESEPSKPSAPFSLKEKEKSTRKPSVLPTDLEPAADHLEPSKGEETSAEKPSPPRCRARQDEVDVLEGEDAVFEIEYSGYPVPVVTWNSTSDVFKDKEHFDLVAQDGLAVCTIKQCKLKDAGEISVTFKNKVGRAEVPLTLRVRQKKSAPRILECPDIIEAHVGDNIAIKARFAGFPYPDVEWLLAEKVVKETRRVRIDADKDYESSIVMKKVEAVDAGRYKVKVFNSEGMAEGTVLVKVLGAPSTPKNLKAVDVTPNKVTIEWQPPESDGGSPVTGYQVEKRSAGRVTWTRVATTTQLVQEITDLIENNKYEFCVRAVNKYGAGEGAEIGPITANFTFDVPGPPGAPECSNTTPTSTMVNWAPPESDGGSPVIGYHVERRTGKMGRWIKINKTVITTTTMTVSDLVESENYEFRVLAENKKGVGKPSEPCRPLKTPLKSKPTKPDTSVAPSVSKRPEIREPGEDKTVDETIGSDVELDEEELPEDEEKGTKPEFLTPLETQVVKEGQKAEFHCEVIGEPKPSVIWQRNGKTIRESHDFRYVVKDNTYKLVIREAYTEDAGTYTVLARNAAGKATSEADLIVKTERPDTSGKEKVPTFVTPLRNQTISTGQTLTLRVQADGVPTPKLKWYRAEHEILPSDVKARIADDGHGGSVLTIRNIELDDAHLYRCVASNPAGEASTEGAVTVESKEVTSKYEAPYFTKKIRDVTVAEGEPLLLDCAFVGIPAPSVKWFLNDKLIQSSADVVIASSPTTSRLEIASAMPEDTGVYTVELTNPGGQAKCIAGINITRRREKLQARGTAPRFVRRFVDTEVAVNYDVTFECQVTGEPTPTIKWFFGKTEIKEETNKYEIVYKEKIGWSRLVIRSVTHESVGQYIAVAENGEGKAQCAAYLNVLDTKVLKPKHDDGKDQGDVRPPTFAKPLRDTEIPEGEKVQLSCKLSEPMNVNVVWTKDGVQLDDGPRFTLENSPDGTLTLTIHKAQKRHEGRYTCTVSNQAGRVKTACELFVAIPKEGPSKPDDSGLKKRGRVAGPPWPLASAPFLSDLTDTGCHLAWKPSITDSTEDTPITYIVEMCEASRNDWHPIRQGLVEIEYDVQNLLQPDRNYRFRIRAENKFGVSDPSPYARTERPIPPRDPDHYAVKPSDRKSYDREPRDYDIVRPEHGGFGEKPRIYRESDNVMYGLEGDTATLECYCYGHPQPKISWYFKGQEIKTGGRFASRYGTSGQVQLSIEKLSFRDVGQYTCIARNEHGEASITLELEVADPPVFIEPIIDATFITGQPARLDCRVDGTPFPEIRWLKDWRPIASSARIEILQEGNHCTLIFHDVRAFDGGLYTVEAKNIGGTAMCTANIFAEAPRTPIAAPFDYKKRRINLKNKRVTDFYDFFEEIGRGTQAVVKRAVEKLSGHNFAAKVSFAPPRDRQWLENEINILNELHHPNIVRLHDGYAGTSYVVLMLEMAKGGEIIPRLTKNKTYGEDYVRSIIKQLLNTLEYVHEKGFAHLDLKPEDILFQHPSTDKIMLVDFGLAQKMPPSGHVISEFGTPEFVSPEIALRSPCNMSADLWSTGIITYLLLSGVSPFLGPTDRDTLLNVQKCEWDFNHPIFSHISPEGKDFITSLLKKDSSRRLTSKEALLHPWFGSTSNAEIDSRPLEDYWAKRRHKLGQSGVVKYARRRPLYMALQHPQGLLYPPDISDNLDLDGGQHVRRGSPGPRSGSQERDRSRRSSVSEDFRDYHFSFFGQSDSHYQVGPETELLQLRDPDLPARIREYRRMMTDPSGNASFRVKASNKQWGLKPAVKERRRMMEVMDEEGFGQAAQLAARRKRRRILAEQTEEFAPFFREKLKDTAFAEGKPVTLRVVVIGFPQPTVHWYHHEILLENTAHIRSLVNEDGNALLTLSPATGVDAGEYKAVARNKLGEAICHATLQLGMVPDHPSWPVLEYLSSTEMTLSWQPPEFDGNSDILAFRLEYRTREDLAWRTVSADLLHENIVVQNLSPNTHYRFRVSCRNQFGWSAYSFSSNEYKTSITGEEPRMIDEPNAHSDLKWRERGAEPQPSKPSRLISLMEKYPAALNENTDPEQQFEFYEQIFHGQFSIIRKCFDRKAQRTLAAKIIDLNASDARHEYEILSGLKNECIVELHVAFTYNNEVMVLIEDLLEGYDIMTYLCEKQVYSEEDVSQIVRQVLDGLQYLHYLGVAHLNLQPENIVSKSRRRLLIQLVDFGAARKLPEGGAVIKLPTVPIEYTPPEILTEKLATVSADIWNIGVLVFILLSGRHPFVGDDDEEAYNNVCYVRYQTSELYRGLSVEVTRLIMQTLKVLPDNRLSVDECLEHRWIVPHEIDIKKREKSTFHCYRLQQYRSERRRHLLHHLTNNQTILNAFHPKDDFLTAELQIS